jgi:flagellar basal body rod protein FlgF
MLLSGTLECLCEDMTGYGKVKMSVSPGELPIIICGDGWIPLRSKLKGEKGAEVTHTMNNQLKVNYKHYTYFPNNITFLIENCSMNIPLRGSLEMANFSLLE